MRAGQREPSGGMIESGLVGPGDRVVADRTLRDRKRARIAGVSWIIRGVKGIQVAARVAAIVRRSRQRIVVVNVTLRAARYFTRRRHLVRIGQRETRGGVIERGIRPARCVVTGRALRRRETSLHVVRDVAAQRLRSVPRRLVATVAIRRG